MINEKHVKQFRALIYGVIVTVLLVPIILMVILFSRMIMLTNSMIHYFDSYQPAQQSSSSVVSQS